MYYAITHLTLFTYSAAIMDSVMEVRTQPRSDGYQRCFSFHLNISPTAKVQTYRDYLQNQIHVFDIPGRHKKLAIRSEALVESKDLPALPSSLAPSTWQVLDEKNFDYDAYDMLMESRFCYFSPALADFVASHAIQRLVDPLSTVLRINEILFSAFEYEQYVTAVDSPIEIALEAKRGVCQDFTHIMIAILRHLGIPARYVSGYLYHRREDQDRSVNDATHAWVEAWLPQLGWVGFDPTNNLVCSARHLRVAIGSDYADVPPTKGVFIGLATSNLEVSVKVSELENLPLMDETLAPEIEMPHYDLIVVQQQQQQQ